MTAMQKLTRQDLMTLEQYAEQRPAFRARVIEHKRHRQVPLGEHARLLFEDRLTVQYQIQEMLRTERIFERAGIEQELEVYNPLIPDGSNWKATFMLEYPDADERARELARMVGIEDTVWVRVGGGEKIYAIADEDLDRSTDVKTASVHFLCFELPAAAAAAVRAGAAIGFGIDHSASPAVAEPVSEVIRAALAVDLG